MRAILYELELQAHATPGDEFPVTVRPDILERAGPGNALREVLARRAEADPTPRTENRAPILTIGRCGSGNRKQRPESR